MSKWFDLLHECEKNKNVENPPMSVLSVVPSVNKEYFSGGHPKTENPCFQPMSVKLVSHSTLDTENKNKNKNILKCAYIPTDKTDIGSILLNDSEAIDSSRFSDTNKKTLTHQDISIIRSYPFALHEFLVTLVSVREERYAALSLPSQEIENFRHNMRWFFVSVDYYIEGWHPQDVRTLWSDGWRELDIIRFLISQKVKYIMYHNSKIIQCLNLQDKVFAFDKTTLENDPM